MSLVVLITGANGFIGANLTSYLLKKNYEVIALVRPGANLNLLSTLCNKNDKLNLVYTDYQDSNELKQIFAKSNIIIHLAAKTTGPSFEDLYISNVELCKKFINILNSLNKDIHFIFLSSQAVSGVSEKNIPKKESDDPKPLTWYGKTKLLSENYIKEQLKNKWTIIRPASVYGRGDADFFHYFKMIEYGITLIPNEADDIYKSVFSHIYIDELTELIEKCIHNPIVYYELLNVANPFICSTEHFLRIISSAIKEVNQNNLTQYKSKHCLKNFKKYIKIHFTIDIPNIITIGVAFISEIIWKINKCLGVKSKFPILNRQKLIEIKQSSWLLDTTKIQNLLLFNPENKLFDNLKETYIWYKENYYL
ncbi:MAG: NAD(P)-dependent oxidoreductase [Candidatus Cloacimonetes bacterium]|jgi:nucleoside-diphosphate-sugar epimerase|nr:NAD(P)-dependent oxidoreductase [Candidatus Cloacimonadota bacterium]MDD4155527.1 NAD(P)-dependent oxidoreductase [Candidatus Cloacimonadota bacterium]